VLGWQPLRWLGVRSYGIYLWHFPIIVLTTPADGRDTLARGAVQVTACIVCAALSWRYVEEPIRRGAIQRWWAQIRSTGWHLSPVGRQARIAVAASAPVIVLASCGMTGVVQPNPATLAASTQPPPARASTASQQPGHAAASKSRGSAHGQVRTSCRAVVHIGDSTSDGLISPDYLPNPQERMGAQYARVGVTTFIPEISGARSIVETYDGQPNAHTVAQQFMRQGYRGCWVLALGTNDTADVYVGSQVSLATRITQMMSLIGNQPVMWVNVKSLLASGPYSESNMLLWNSALIRACASHPNMRVYNWAAAARDSWFIADGIHYTSAGYAARANLIARALAAAFPERSPAARAGGAGADGAGHPPSCLVS
jgi:lysophospholipase L1-like esterase